MARIPIAVSAEHIADANRGIASPNTKEPLARAIAAVIGLPVGEVMLDGDGEDRAIVTLGQDRTTLVQELPADAGAWYWRWWNLDDVEPFQFDLELEDWLVALIARFTSTDEQGQAVLASEGRA